MTEQPPSALETFQEIYELAQDALRSGKSWPEQERGSYMQEALQLISRLCEHPLEEDKTRGEKTPIPHRQTAGTQYRDQAKGQKRKVG